MRHRRPLTAKSSKLCREVTRLLKATTGYLPSPLKTFEGARVLEVGPGCNCGWLIVVACAGAIPATVDAYPVRWDSDYHLPLCFADCVNDWKGANLLLPRSPWIRLSSRRVLRRYLDREAVWNRPTILTTRTTWCSPTQSLNICTIHSEEWSSYFVSLVRVASAVIGSISATTETSAVPWNTWWMSDEAFNREFGLRHGECGNRCRQDETAHQLTDVGFEILDFETTFEVEADYLAELLPRLRLATHSKYRDVEDERLRVLHGRFLVRKPE